MTPTRGLLFFCLDLSFRYLDVQNALSNSMTELGLITKKRAISLVSHPNDWIDSNSVITHNLVTSLNSKPYTTGSRSSLDTENSEI
jgi:hypothetical protein